LVVDVNISLLCHLHGLSKEYETPALRINSLLYYTDSN
jgi:hypothetical protein